MRTLASIQAINAIEPITGADAIERARVLGWWVVVKRGEFRTGDAVVYCEIDSLLPERPAFEFLRKSCWRPAITTPAGEVLLPAGFRIKTVKLRGQVSQGICFPLSILPDDSPREVGADVTAALGIVKFDPPLPASMSGRVKGAFPGFVPKTDETRVQILEAVIARHRGKTFYVTEKLDGTSFTAFVRRGEFGVCSRNQWLDETDLDNTLCRVANELELATRLAAARARAGFDLAIQGEIIGPGLQGNKYARTRAELHVFNVVNLDTLSLVPHAELLAITAAAELTVVPQLGTVVLDHAVDALVELSIGTSALNPKTPREGIVLRPLLDERDPELGRLSFKAINPKFLLQYDE
jgi:RNA ligase (TIGR02306 family)